MAFVQQNIEKSKKMLNNCDKWKLSSLYNNTLKVIMIGLH